MYMLFKEMNGSILMGNMPLKEPAVIISPESKIVCKTGENATLKKYMASMSKKNSDSSSKYYLYSFSDALNAGLLTPKQVIFTLNALQSTLNVEEIITAIMSERYDRLILILNNLKQQNLQI